MKKVVGVSRTTWTRHRVNGGLIRGNNNFTASNSLSQPVKYIASFDICMKKNWEHIRIKWKLQIVVIVIVIVNVSHTNRTGSYLTRHFSLLFYTFTHSLGKLSNSLTIKIRVYKQEMSFAALFSVPLLRNFAVIHFGATIADWCCRFIWLYTKRSKTCLHAMRELTVHI